MNYFVLLNEGEYAQAFEEKPEVGEMDSVYDDFDRFISDSYIERPEHPPCPFPEGADQDERNELEEKWTERCDNIWDDLSNEERYASLLEELKKGEKIKIANWFEKHPFTWPS